MADDAPDRSNGPTHEDVIKALDEQKKLMDDLKRQMEQIQAKIDEMRRRYQDPRADEG